MDGCLCLPPMSLPQACDNGVAGFTPLDGFKGDAFAIDTDEWRALTLALAATSDLPERQIISFCQRWHVALQQSVVDKQRAAEAVFALIDLGSEISWRFEQGQSHRAAAHVIVIFAVVEEGDAEIGLGQIHPAVHDGFKARLIPGGIAMGWPPHMAELDFGGAVACHQIERKSGLDQRVLLMLVNEAVDIEAFAAGLERNDLNDL